MVCTYKAYTGFWNMRLKNTYKQEKTRDSYLDNIGIGTRACSIAILYMASQII